MRQDVIARQVAAMRDAGLDAIVSIRPENFAYVTGFLSPTAADHALASRHGAGDGRRHVRARRRRHGGEHDPRQGAGRDRDRGLARVQVRCHERARRSAAQARPRQGAHRHRDGLSAGRRFRRAAQAPARRANFTAAQAICWRGCARSRRRRRSTSCAGCRASPTRRSPTPTTPCAPARARWTSRRR